jgi:hypothetical protein
LLYKNILPILLDRVATFKYHTTNRFVATFKYHTTSRFVETVFGHQKQAQYFIIFFSKPKKKSHVAKIKNDFLVEVKKKVRRFLGAFCGCYFLGCKQAAKSRSDFRRVGTV